MRNKKHYKVKNKPIVGQKYNCFEDGKIRRSRLYKVRVTKVVPFEDADDSIIRRLRQEVVNIPHLYAKETDYFIYTDNVVGGEDVFVRKKCGGWFSLGLAFYCGVLDVDGELTKVSDEKAKIYI